MLFKGLNICHYIVFFSTLLWLAEELLASEELCSMELQYTITGDPALHWNFACQVKTLIAYE